MLEGKELAACSDRVEAVPCFRSEGHRPYLKDIGMEPSTSTEAVIRRAIEIDGPITFRRYMEMALYGTPDGYYGSGQERIGTQGDFLTSPQIHPAFGALVARQLEQLWLAMARPDPFTVVEMGAGTASLARDILNYSANWSPAFHQALAYTIVERSTTAEERQRAAIGALGAIASRVKWRLSPQLDLPEGSLVGCLLSNELLDAFPVHRVRTVGGQLHELYVGLKDGNLVDVPGPLSDPTIQRYFDRLGTLPPEGCTGEVNLDALEWVRAGAQLLARGAAITFDYGYPAPELYSARHRDGTLLCFYRHTLNGDPYARIGRQDITAHVDFSSISSEGEEWDLHLVGLTTQRKFLLAMGADGYLRNLGSAGLRRRDREANAVAIEALLQPEGLGRIGVMIQQKGVDVFSPAGLSPTGLRPGDLGRDLSIEMSPLLTSRHPRLNAPPTEQLAQEDAEAMWRELMGEEDAL